MPIQDIEDIYELSPLQQGMLFHTLFDPSSGEYFEQESYPLDGPIDIPAFVRAWQQVIQRHTALRTSFHWEGLDKPVQVVHRRAELPVDVQDWSGISESEQEKRLDAYLSSDRKKRFEISVAPLIRAALLKRSPSVLQFVLSFHHILLDGWSGRLITDEVWRFYEANCQGKELKLPRVQPYGEFIGWLQRQDLARAEVFWRGVLTGFRAPTPLAVGSQVGGGFESSPEEGERGIRLARQTTAALQRLGRANRLTLNTLIQGAWALLLSRYSGEADVVFGTVVSGRPADLAGVDSMVGLFINTLPLRTRVVPDSFIIPWLKDLQAQQLETRNFEYCPLVQIQNWSELPQGVRLFESIVILTNYPGSGDLDYQDDEPDDSIHYFAKTNYPLNLMVMPGTHLELRLSYSEEQFDKATVTRMLGHLRTILQELARDPDRRLHDLPLLTGSEIRLFERWNATGTEYPDRQTIPSLFDLQVARTPEATALADEAEQLSYAQLNRRANRLAHYLRGLGIGAEKRVGVCMTRCNDIVIAILGILKAGGAYVPMDPAYPRDRLAFMLDDAAVHVLLTQTSVAAKLPTHSVTTLNLDSWRPPPEASGEPPTNQITPDDLAYVIYTSGSTGRPKGVLGSHRAAVNRFSWMWKTYPFAPHEVCCARTSVTFVDSVWEIFGPLLSGIQVVVLSDETTRDVHKFLVALAARRATRVLLVPSLLRVILETGGDLQNTLPDLKYWVTSGEALPPDLCRAFRMQVPHGTLLNLYGSSEVAGDATFFEVGSRPPTQSVPIGRPLFNVQTYIVDKHMRRVPVGVSGELLVGGVCLARGYHNRPELTAEKFIANPFENRSGTRLYKTGDIARYLPNGDIEFLGRADQQLKIRGFRVELEEIETVLSEHPEIRQAAVAARQEEQGDQSLVAYMVRQAAPRHFEPLSAPHSTTNERLSQWREVWDETFNREPEQQDPLLNLSGWNSSYTGLPIPAEEMTEWVNQAVGKVRSLQPRSVLEIGCGLGLLLFRIAPYCERYCGTDFSRTALRYVEEQSNVSDLPQVTLLHRTADNFHGFDPGSFDAVILNSVVQYFPSIEYLRGVLEGAVKVLRPGGVIFLGDVRSLPLLNSLQTSVELHRAPATLSIAQLQERVRNRVMEEEELLIDPAFFFALQQHLPEIGQVQVEPKRGRYRNEMTRFRFEVTIQLKAADNDREEIGSCKCMDWREEHLSLSKLRTVLREDDSDCLLITGIPNARLVRDTQAWKLLRNPDGLQTAGDLRKALRNLDEEGLDPEEVYALEADAPYRVQMLWAGLGADDRLDAFIRRRSDDAALASRINNSWFGLETSEAKPWSSYANHPLAASPRHGLIPRLRRFLRAKLPEYMVPAHFVLLDALPLTPSGKLDRHALPSPNMTRRASEEPYVAPRTHTEEVIVRIWAELLGIERIGVSDNFFEMGGHSLLAVRVLSRMREGLKLEVPLRAIFETPTIAGLAQLIDEARARGETDTVEAIPRIPRETHAAAVLPGGVLDPSDLRKGTRGNTKSVRVGTMGAH